MGTVVESLEVGEGGASFEVVGELRPRAGELPSGVGPQLLGDSTPSIAQKHLHRLLIALMHFGPLNQLCARPCADIVDPQGEADRRVQADALKALGIVPARQQSAEDKVRYLKNRICDHEVVIICEKQVAGVDLGGR